MPRPKAFDPALVLQRALMVFWRQGFAATSVQDLVDGMGINRFSLYSTFGDKQTLFRSACAAYSAQFRAEWLGPLDDDPRGLAAVEGFFDRLVAMEGHGQAPYGCLMINTLVELGPHDEYLRDLVEQHLRAIEDSLARALRRARAAGELTADQTPRQLARFLVTVFVGQSVGRKLRRDRQALRATLRVALATLR